MVQAHAVEARLDPVHDVAARGAAVVGPPAHLAVDLGGDDHVAALDPEVAQRLADQLFGLPGRVNVGRVDEVDTRGQGPLDHGVDAGLGHRANGAPHAGRLFGEGHGAEAYLGNIEARAAQSAVLHHYSPNLTQNECN